MIPIALTLRNFMSYGEEEATLSFRDFHVACLCGDNGNGKSALLDAITWALWGRTRASSVRSVSEDEIIRMGAEEAEVRFEFAFDSHEYRVLRKRRRGKTGDWQLAVKSPSGHYSSIGGNSHRETERRLTQLLSMEYDTFVNSAYLQQGKADEFTRQTPHNRKRILGEILGLDRYDRLEAKARERARERKELQEDLEREIRLLEAESVRLPEHREMLATTEREQASLRERTAAQEAETARARDFSSKLEALAEALAGREQAFRRLETEAAQRSREQEAGKLRLLQLQEVRAQRESILGDFAALQRARERREKLQPVLENHARQLAQLQDVNRIIELEKRQREGDLNLLQKDLTAVEQRCLESRRLAKEIAGITSALQDEMALTEAITAAQARLQEARETFAELKARNETLRENVREIEEVLELLQKPAATCPVCESDLSAERQTNVIARQQSRRETLCAELERLKCEGARQKVELTEVTAIGERLARQREEQTLLRRRMTELQDRFEALDREGVDPTPLRQKSEKLKEQLARNEYAIPAWQRRHIIENDLKQLEAARQEDEILIQQIRKLEPAQRRYQDYMYAEESWERESEEAGRLEVLVSEKLRQCAEEREALKRERSRLAECEAARHQAMEAEARLARLQAEVTEVTVRISRIRDQIARCDAASVQRNGKATELRDVARERETFTTLAAAFGKNGIQALMIENTLPELEEDANQLLQKMTDNAMQVQFETTRAARSRGSEIETLDIRVLDDRGSRPYELFSGGEAFRINLAVRIALSRLLARRSGARLQTLILDEGFGTQDGKGREKLLDVIDSIKDDFEKILVITHVEELKDSFPQRIEITRDAAGSHIHVI